MKTNVIFNEDCLIGLQKLPDNSIDCCISSPPYWGLRDYGVEGQIGLEDTPEEYVEQMVNVFREVKRVLKPEGTLWLNLGDSYANNTQEGNKVFGNVEFNKNRPSRQNTITPQRAVPNGLKAKDLVGIPWMVAFALRADGWYLRQDIIWHKPNPMPESVKDRCTKAHEYIFLLAKSQKYFYDSEAIKEKSNYPGQGGAAIGHVTHSQPGARRLSVTENLKIRGEKRNKRSVWTVTTKPFKEAHFATFPEKLIEPCILAGCPAGGIVLDPFMGSGTTAVVARKLNRSYIGYELNPEYVKMANDRLYKELGMWL